MMFRQFHNAPVVELADTLDLGSNAERCAGSSPVRCIIIKARICMFLIYRYVLFMLYYILIKHIILYQKYSILKCNSDTALK